MKIFFFRKTIFLGLKFEWNLSVNTERSGTDYCWLYCAKYAAYECLIFTFFHLHKLRKSHISRLLETLEYHYRRNSIRDHSSITSSKRWVGGVRKWQFLMIYSTANHQRVGWVGLKKSKHDYVILEWSLTKLRLSCSM